MKKPYLETMPDEKGYFGEYGGSFLPPPLEKPFQKIRKAYDELSRSIKYPCFYGIDTPTKEELINATKTQDEVCSYIGANSLSYLTIDELKEAIGEDRNYSLVSFDGDYFIK